MSKALSNIAKLFKGQTAWFSSSVLPKARGLWIALGGTECSLDTADFVFSEDVDTPDTASIFVSPLYCKNGLAVIHPTYIYECIVAEDIMDIALGDYILYPESIQNFIKQRYPKNQCPMKTRQHTSAMGNKARNISPGSSQKIEAKRKSDIEEKNSITSQQQEREDAVHLSDMQLISGDLEDFIPGENQWLVYHL